MTLREQLCLIKEDEYVYIGAKKGSGFIYIGRCKDAVDEIEKCYDIANAYLELAIERGKKRIATGERLIKEYSAKLDDDLYKERLSSVILRKKSAENGLRDNIERADRLKPYLDQEVLERYPRKMCEPFGTILICDIEQVGNGKWYLDDDEVYHDVQREKDIS